jgi:hypothetical protein
MPQDITELAARLAKATADRVAIPPLSDGLPGLDAGTGYAIQAVAREAAGPLAGWKLGATSRAKQAQVGVHEPVRGFLASASALEARVDAGVTLHDRRPVGPRQPGQERPDDLLRGRQRRVHVDAGLDAQPVEGRGQHLGGGVPRGAGIHQPAQAYLIVQDFQLLEALPTGRVPAWVPDVVNQPAPGSPRCCYR